MSDNTNRKHYPLLVTIYSHKAAPHISRPLSTAQNLAKIDDPGISRGHKSDLPPSIVQNTDSENVSQVDMLS